jgi:quercetin dioxygenase-like cupin family protein
MRHPHHHELIDTSALLAAAVHDGPLWSIASAQLNANLLRLSTGQTIPAHVNGAVDVLLVVLAGQGSITIDADTYTLFPGSVVVIPRGAQREIVSQSDPLAYVTCHVRRAGLLPE